MRRWETRTGDESSSRLVSVSALMTIVSGGLLVAIPLLRRTFLLANSPLAAQAVFDVGLYVFVAVALFFVPAGMLGFHALQRSTVNYKFIEHAGFWMVIVTSLVLASGLAGYLWWEDPALLWLVSPVGALGMVVGFILYGAATLRAGVLPIWCGMVFIGALPAAIALVWVRPYLGLGEGTSITSILSGLAWLSLGYTLWTRTAQSR